MLENSRVITIDLYQAGIAVDVPRRRVLNSVEGPLIESFRESRPVADLDSEERCKKVLEQKVLTEYPEEKRP